MNIVPHIWIPVAYELPTHIYSVVVWVVGGPLHYGEDYMDVGVWNEKKQRWQTSGAVVGKSDDIEVIVSHWMQITSPWTGTEKRKNDEHKTRRDRS